jgi:hypothetical protein
LVAGARPASAQTRVTSSRQNGLFADFFDETAFIMNLQLIIGDHKRIFENRLDCSILGIAGQ